MPKDPKKNVDRYKIRGGQLNEFDFHQNQEQYAKEKAPTGKNLIPVKVAKATKSTKDTKVRTAIGASAKKLAARKAEKKR